MKKVLLFALSVFVLLFPLFLFSSSADEAVVFVGGEGDGYATLKDAAEDLPASGGTIVVRGPFDHSTSQGVTLPAKRLTVTSVWENVDYAETAGAYFGLGRTLNLGADLTFEHLTIKMTATGVYGNIYAQDHALTVGEGVTTVANGSTSKYPTLFGGFSANKTATLPATSVTVASGTWQNVYGGNYGNTLKADCTVTVTGGRIVDVLCGGNRSGALTGNTHLDFSGGEAGAVCGGVYGVSGGSGSMTGNVDLDIHGTANVTGTVFGVSYYSNIVFNGNVDIDLYGEATLGRHVYGGCLGTSGTANITLLSEGCVVRARENVRFVRPSDTSNFLCGGSSAGTVTGDVSVFVSDHASLPGGNVYAGGYSGSVNGNSTAEITGGEVGVNFTAGSRTGSVTGTASTRAYGGRIGNYSGGPFDLLGKYNGTVGTALVLLDGADIAGKVSLNGAAGTLTLKSGSASYCEGTCEVDLSGAKTLSVGGTLTASSITGGGTLRIPAATTVTADSLSGSLTLRIDGEPVGDQVYLTVAEQAAGAEVLYTPIDDEALNETEAGGVVSYTMRYADRYNLVTVRIRYYNPRTEGGEPSIVLRRGVYNSSDDIITGYTAGTENGKRYIEATLTPGLYGCKVYYNGSNDYRIKHIYVSGKTAAQEYDVPLEPYAENSWSENVFANQTDEVSALFGTEGLIGYEGFDTPTFSLEGSVRNFMNNDQLCDYVDALAAGCEYLHLYYPFAVSAMGNRTPVLVFTKADITDKSFDEAAAYLRSLYEGTRDIVFITGSKHGNEPAGIEGALAFSKDLTGAYGEEVLEKIGAIVVMPCVEVDNNQRFKRTTESGINPNRDMVALYLESSQNQVYVYKSLMPSVTIDCHEDSGNSSIDPGDFSVDDLVDICVHFSTNYNSPLYDGTILRAGTFDATALRGNQIMMDVIERTKAVGLRGSVYSWNYTMPGTAATYGTLRGSYGFLVETMRIWTGTGRYARAVFGIEQALKGLVAEVIEAADAGDSLAADVAANRARVAAITEYDENNLFAGAHSASGTSQETGIKPTVYVSGIWKDPDDTRTVNLPDTLSDMIVLPTAYVVSADAADLDDVLRLLDLHGIPYTKLQDGATLTLRRYSGGYENTAIGAAEEVTFEHGAYAVTLNSSDAYLIAYLFEPNSFRFTSAVDHTSSFEHMGYLTDADGLYRSEEDNVYLIVEALRAPLAFSGASLTLENDLTFNFKADASLFGAGGYADPYVDFFFNGKVRTVTEYRVENGKYVFSFTGIAPHQMNDVLTATLHADLAGTDVTDVREYSVGEYCYDAYGQYGDAQYAQLHRLLADLLQYGARSQEYMSYRTDALVTDRLAVYPDLAACATVGTPTYETVRDLAVATVTSPAAVFKGAGLNLQNTVAIRLKIRTDEDVATLTLKASKAGGGEYEVPGTEFLAAEAGVYYAFFTGFNAGEMKKTVNFTVYQGENAVSDTIAYSIESYAYDKQGDASLTELLSAMMNYGESARLYQAAQ